METSGISYKTSPIDTLPAEILADVIERCLPRYTPSMWTTHNPRTKPFSIEASHVCRRWREIALGDPLIWSRIAICVPQVEMFESFLERSRELPIHLRINFGLPSAWRSALASLTPTRQSLLWTMISRLAESVQRCFKLEISANDREIITTLSSVLSNVAAPNLKEFSFVKSGIWTISCTDSPIFGGGTPQLSNAITVGITYSSPWIRPILKNLTYLSLRNVRESTMPNRRDFESLISASPSLTHLVLNDKCFESDFLSFDPIPIPTLVTLEIIYGDDDLLHFRELLTSLHIPALQCLSLQLSLVLNLKQTDVHFIQIFVDTLRMKHYDHLRELRLFDIELKFSTAYSLIYCIPSIEHVRCSEGSIIVPLVTRDEDLMRQYTFLQYFDLWPNLHTVSFGLAPGVASLRKLEGQWVRTPGSEA
ncbi:hypothetical protein JAAARDRAFT_196659 [Jaapia argillacea MUCL 33604]|uniref:Uncharacterized protein n=1 Tax=Jaapia argillacea MUCL 33604 TaxID=933084 RepID=A0A067PKB5_9AGAM|nr:hypothetical protein JAAARDRAFT_196659 [Jaapia argillacea MUCL 33604]